MLMDTRELKILSEIEAGLYESDAAFAGRIASGPSLSALQKAGLAAATIAGLGLVMLFPANLVFGLVGYLMLVAVGTTALRRRPLKPAQETPLDFFHRMTAGLFRDPGTRVEADVDES